MPRDEVVSRFDAYVQDFSLPVELGVSVTSVEHEGRGYRIAANGHSIHANNVVIATGLYQRPKVPEFSALIPAQVHQLHSGAYRNPSALPDGAVLVVGSAQSGCQIAQELHESGRTVYFGVGGTGRIPRRYRGKDIFEWLQAIGFFDRRVDDLPSPEARFSPNPQLSGRDGGRTLNVHEFARDGINLLGHVRGADDRRLVLAEDLHESLARCDEFEATIVGRIDDFIERNEIDAPSEELTRLTFGYEVPQLEELSWRGAGITSVIWATGYAFDFSLVSLPTFDGFGYPLQVRGVTDYPGLYFVGLPWLSRQKSGLLLGVGEDAAHVAASISHRPRSPR